MAEFSLVFVLLAVVVIVGAHFVDVSKFRSELAKIGNGIGPQVQVLTVDAPYRATIVYEPKDFAVDEQFLLSPTLLQLTEAALRKRRQPLGVIEVLRREGWKARNVNGRTLVVRHRRVSHGGIRLWPPRTNLKFSIATPRLGGEIFLEPDHSSSVLLNTLSETTLVDSTSPSSETTDGGRTRAIDLGTSGSFSAASTIEINVNSSWARNQPAQYLVSLVHWNPFYWIWSAVLGILSLLSVVLLDEVKDRLKRRLGLGRVSKGAAV